MYAMGFYSATQSSPVANSPWGIDWGTTALEEFGSWGTTYLNGGHTLLERVPAGCITLIRWVWSQVNEAPIPGFTGPEDYWLGFFDSAAAQVPSNEYAADYKDFGFTPTNYQQTMCGSILIDGDASPPGAGFPYTWVLTASGVNIPGGAQLLFMSWLKP